MDINITGRNVELDEPLKDYIHKRLDKLDRLYRRIYKCDVILEEEKIRKNVEIILYLKKNRIIAKESSTDMYASIDNATESIKKQVRRLSGKISSRRRKAVLDKILRRQIPDIGEVDMLNVDGDKSGIVKSDIFASKPMLPREAQLELELLEQDFIMFKNADTGESNVLYRMNDNNFGLIEPNF